MSLLDRVREIAARRPDHPALSAGDIRLTCGGLWDAARRRADPFARASGVVALDGSRPVEFVVDFLAAGLAQRPSAAHPPGVPSALRARREEILAAHAPAGGQTVFFSSGSVGTGKAVPLSLANLEAAALAFEEWGELSPDDRVAIGLSPAHVFGFVRGALNTLCAGAHAMFYTPRRDPLADADGLGATVVLMPTALVPLAARRDGRVTARAVRVGGGVLSDVEADRLEAGRGVSVRSGYGLTESAGLGARQPERRSRRHGAVGLPAPGMRIEILGADGSPVAPGESGEIRLRGAAVFSGYLDPEDASPFDGAGRLHTGDVGFLDAEGELHVRGRLAYSLAAGGRVVCAEELEEALAEHPGVEEAAAAPLPARGAFGVLFVARDASETLLSEIRTHAEGRLPAFARPRRFLRVPEIPRTAGGKVDRAEAARWLAGERTKG